LPTSETAKTGTISQENAFHLLESLSLRERMDHERWDLRQMKSNIQQMKKIADSVVWKSSDKSPLHELVRALDELSTIIQQKDATRVVAGHTHLEHALSQVRNSTFGL
jgi:hypothetical protein